MSVSVLNFMGLRALGESLRASCGYGMVWDDVGRALVACSWRGGRRFFSARELLGRASSAARRREDAPGRRERLIEVDELCDAMTASIWTISWSCATSPPIGAPTVGRGWPASSSALSCKVEETVVCCRAATSARRDDLLCHARVSRRCCATGLGLRWSVAKELRELPN